MNYFIKNKFKQKNEAFKLYKINRIGGNPDLSTLTVSLCHTVSQLFSQSYCSLIISQLKNAFLV